MRQDLELPEELARRLAGVRSVGAITGAGVSAESGIRTYRGAGGLYDDPAQGERTVEALSGATLLRDPDRTWRAIADLARQARSARPGPAHWALAALERRVERFVLLTQNVDGLHQAAGSRNVIDIHGSIHAARCLACGRGRRLTSEDLAALDRAPRCAGCGGRLRPDAVLFGELLPLDKVARVRDELHARPPDLVLVAGTSALFPYIVEPVLIARRRGRLCVEINLEPTALSGVVDHALRGPAGRWLPRISRALAPARAAERPRDRFGRPLAPGAHDELGALPRLAAASPPLEQALALFAQQRFFEAHEWFERVWRAAATPEEDRPFWRAVTQLAVGLCHRQRGNAAGAAKVLARARAGLAGFPDRYGGLDVARLRAAAERDLPAGT